jgi:chemotaxis protein CheZ
MGAAQQKTKPNETSIDALINLSDKLKANKAKSMSLTDVIGVAELLTSSLQPLLRQIDSTIHNELRGILKRIEGLRHEIAKVRADDISNNKIPQMGKELSAIVEATEGATNSIMEAAESVLDLETNNFEEYKQAVSDKMMSIFEACSFQDLTGQRVTKIVQTVEIIEERINLLCEMLDMSGTDEQAPTEELNANQKRNKELLLNGPANDGEGVDQSAIDELF